MTVTIRYEILCTYSVYYGKMWEVWAYNDATDGKRHLKTLYNKAAAEAWLHNHTETF